jgi:tetratricopeptide (TPR) repeat protein
MNFSGLFKKKGVPEELPDLAIDEIKKDLKENINELGDINLKQETNKQEEKLEISEDKSSVKGQIQSNMGNDEKCKKFFDKLIEDINQEIDDLEKFDNWIGEYWENKRKDFVIKNLGGNFKERINNKIERLQKLEKEWQDTYFNLIEKEEEMKNMEKDLKNLFLKFGKVCKRRGDIKNKNS